MSSRHAYPGRFEGPQDEDSLATATHVCTYCGLFCLPDWNVCIRCVEPKRAFIPKDAALEAAYRLGGHAAVRVLLAEPPYCVRHPTVIIGVV